MHDLLSINDNSYNSQFRQGELFLPCNFVSDVRGSARCDNEELFRAANGLKLYLMQSSKKVQPDGLFLALMQEYWQG